MARTCEPSALANGWLVPSGATTLTPVAAARAGSAAGAAPSNVLATAMPAGDAVAAIGADAVTQQTVVGRVRFGSRSPGASTAKTVVDASAVDDGAPAATDAASG